MKFLLGVQFLRLPIRIFAPPTRTQAHNTMAHGFWYMVWCYSSVLLLNRFGLALPGVSPNHLPEAVRHSHNLR